MVYSRFNSYCNKTHTFILLITLFALTFPIGGLFSQNATHPVLSLKECLQFALVNQPELARIKLNHDLFIQQMEEKKAQFLPQIRFFSHFDIYPNLPTTLFPGTIIGREGELVPLQFGDTYNLESGLEARQVLFDARMFQSSKQRIPAEKLVELNIRKEEEMILFEIMDQYFELLNNQIQAQLIPTQIARLLQLQEVVALNIANGNLLTIESKKIDIQMKKLRFTQAQLSKGLSRQYQYLSILMGKELTSTEIENVPKLEIPDIDHISSPSDSLPLSQLAEYQLLAQREQLTQIQSKSEQSEKLPQLSLFARHSYQAQRSSPNFFSTNEEFFTISLIGIRLTVPIFNGFLYRAKLQQSQIQLRQQSLERIHNTRLLKLSYENALQDWQESKEMLDLQKETLQLALEEFDISQLQFREGITPLPVLLSSESELRSAENAVLTQEIVVKRKLLALMKSQGKLSTYLSP